MNWEWWHTTAVPVLWLWCAFSFGVCVGVYFR